MSDGMRELARALSRETDTEQPEAPAQPSTWAELLQAIDKQ